MIERHVLSFVAAAGLTSAVMFAGDSAQAQSLGQVGAGSELVLPLDVSSLDGEIAIEIDAIDVTEFASIIDGKLVLSPNIPLDPGPHQITVYLFDGTDYRTLGSYEFSSAGGAPTTGSAGTTISVNANHEAGVRSVNDDVESVAVSSGTVELTTEDGTLSGRVGYLGTSESTEQINGNPIDITEYFLEYRKTGGTLDFTGRLGHQTLSYDQALIGDISRRGVSFLFETPGERFRFGMFGVRSQNAYGVENVTGLQRDSDRIYGAQLAFRPFAQSDFRISVQGYEGNGTADGALTVGSGSGYAFSIDGSAASGRLRYSAHYGKTKWDEDGGGAVFARENGEAILAYLDYDLLADTGNGRSLTVGLGYERVDQPYFSLANPGLPTGAETFILNANYLAERLSLNLYADTQKSNIGGLATDVTDRNSLISLDGTYDLQTNAAGATTSLRFGAGVNWQERLITPPAAPAPDDFTALSFSLGLGGYTDTSSWSVDYDFISRDEHSPLKPNETSHGLSASFDHRFTNTFGLRGTGLTTYVSNSNDDWWRTEASLGLQYEIVPSKWSLAVDVGATTTDEPGAEGGGFGSAELAWHINPAASLVLNATYREGAYANESGTGNDTIFGLFLRANTSFTR